MNRILATLPQIRRRSLVGVAEGKRISIERLPHIIDCDLSLIIPPEGGFVREQNRMGKVVFDPAMIQYLISPKQKRRTGPSPRGYALRAEFAGQRFLSPHFLDYLVEHPDLIPAFLGEHILSEGDRIIFWGAIFQGLRDIRELVRCLLRVKGHYQAGICWLDDRFGPTHLAVGLKD